MAEENYTFLLKYKRILRNSRKFAENRYIRKIFYELILGKLIIFFETRRYIIKEPEEKSFQN